MTDYYGHATRPNGTHVRLTREDADMWIAAAEAASAREENLMPDTEAILSMMCGVRNRLRKLGWSEGMYCPKGGEDFAAITNGSSGIFIGCYIGEWPTGDIWILGESSHHSEIWWKPLEKLTDDERAKMVRDMDFNRECIDGEVQRFAQMARRED